MRRILPIILILILAGIAIVWLVNRGDNDILPDETDIQIENGINQAEPTVSQEEHLSGANIGNTVDATGQEEVTVAVSDMQFDTTILRISRGTTVTWVNEGNVSHDVAPAQGSPNTFERSPVLAAGASYQYTFTDAGTYYYLCTLHPAEMRAVIEVVD